MNEDTILENLLNEIDECQKKVESKDYINWIETLLKNKNCITDAEILYSKEYSEKDKENAKILSYFMTFLVKKHTEQLVFPFPEEGCFIYYFKINDIFYKIREYENPCSDIKIEKINTVPIEYVYLSEKVPDEEMKERELIEYIVINKDLNLSAGKIAVHVGHASTIAAIEEKGTPEFEAWYQNGSFQKKIILEASEKQLEKLEKDFYSVRDLGYTEVPPNTLIAVSLGIMSRRDAKPYIKRLQMFKK